MQMAKENPLYADRIVQDPEILVGRAVVKGTGIPVERVLAHLARDPNLDNFLVAFPRLTVEDVQAVLASARELAAQEHMPMPPPVKRPRTAGEALLGLAQLGADLGFNGPPDLSARIDDELYGQDA